MTPSQVVDNYLNALAAGDLSQLRAYLSSEKFRYRGPIGQYDDADAFVESLAGVPAILEGIERRRRFAESNEVCDVLTFRTRMSEVNYSDVVQWTTVEHDVIVSIEAFFDAHDYKMMFEVQT